MRQSLTYVCQAVLFILCTYNLIDPSSNPSLSCSLCHTFSFAFSHPLLFLFLTPFFPSNIFLAACAWSCSSIYECLCGGVRGWWGFQTQRWANFPPFCSHISTALSTPLYSKRKKDSLRLSTGRFQECHCPICIDDFTFSGNLHLYLMYLADGLIQSDLHCIHTFNVQYAVPVTSSCTPWESILALQLLGHCKFLLNA